MLNWLSGAGLTLCPWDIPALLVLAAVIVLLVVHEINHKRRERRFQESLGIESADKVVDSLKR